MFINSQSPTEHIRHYVVEHLPEIDITNAVVSGNDGARDPLTFVTLFCICIPMFPIYIIVVVIRRRVYRNLESGKFSKKSK
uniref:G_PROTEIN_RECEP_F1_2 domain-containing protein n=1 Tax=Steinernema glaseri TaxID=37863 RepID=A0A1I8A6V3_9BILA